MDIFGLLGRNKLVAQEGNKEFIERFVETRNEDFACGFCNGFIEACATMGLESFDLYYAGKDGYLHAVEKRFGYDIAFGERVGISRYVKFTKSVGY